MENLSSIDPFGDRVMKNVPALIRNCLTKDELWHNSRKSNGSTPLQMKLPSTSQAILKF